MKKRRIILAALGVLLAAMIAVPAALTYADEGENVESKTPAFSEPVQVFTTATAPPADSAEIDGTTALHDGGLIKPRREPQ